MLGVILLAGLAFALALNSTPIPYELLYPKQKADGPGRKLALFLLLLVALLLFVALLETTGVLDQLALARGAWRR